jgi:methionine biosynthesis protein MetW
VKKYLSILKNRADLSIIADWIESGSSVLDLGCGNGELLNYLIRTKHVKGIGVEINLEHVINCIDKGIPVIEHDLNQAFNDIQEKTFDYVILSQTIQEVTRPDLLIDEILRIGRYGIISFPNFGNYKLRWSLMLSGKMPKSRTLPYEWYDTPNIHLLTYSDFMKFCNKRRIKIFNSIHLIADHYKKTLFLPNLFSDGCVVLISK